MTLEFISLVIDMGLVKVTHHVCGIYEGACSSSALSTPSPPPFKTSAPFYFVNCHLDVLFSFYNGNKCG